MVDTALTPAELAEIQQAYRSELLAATAASLRQRAPGAGLETVADSRAPAAVLLAAAQDAVLIVVDATGAGTVERWLLGSTAMQLLGPTETIIDWEAIARTEAGTLTTILAPYRQEFPDVEAEPRSRRRRRSREDGTLSGAPRPVRRRPPRRRTGSGGATVCSRVLIPAVRPSGPHRLVVS